MRSLWTVQTFRTCSTYHSFLPTKNPCRKTSDRAHCVRYHLAMETDCCFLLDWAITEPPLFSTLQRVSKKGLSGDAAASFSAVFTIHCLSEKNHQPDSDPGLLWNWTHSTMIWIESQMSFGDGLRAVPWGVLPFDCVRKRFIGFYRFKGGWRGAFVILSGEKRRMLRKRWLNHRIRFHMDFYT